MAKIVHSELAPDEVVHYSLGAVEFDLGGKSGSKSFETDDRAVLSNAEAHPWLSVEYPKVESLGPAFHDNQVHPEDDIHSAQGPRANDAFDLEKIKADLEARRAEFAPLAIDAGLDQSEPVQVGDVAETIAADESHEAAKSAKAFKTDSSSTDADTEDNN